MTENPDSVEPLQTIRFQTLCSALLGSLWFVREIVLFAEQQSFHAPSPSLRHGVAITSHNKAILTDKGAAIISRVRLVPK